MNDVAARLAVPIRWLLVAGVAYTVAMAVLYFLSPPATTPVASAGRQTMSQNRPGGDLNAVLTANLFGATDEVAQQPTDEPAVATRLPLDLLGVFVADDPDRSMAIISQRGREGIRYHIGDTVPGNATLIEVHAHHVVLRRAGSRESLHFPEPGEGLASAVAPYAPGSDDSFPEELDQYASGEFETPFDGPEEDIDPNMAEPSVEALVDAYREELQSDPQQTLEDLGVEPVNDGEAQGYRVGNLADSPYLSQTGLQPGDVILSVNGRPVGDLQADRLELDNVLAQGSARLEVQRGSRRFFVTATLQ